MNENKKPDSFADLIDSVKRLITLNLDYARLTAAEKLTVLMSSMAFYAVLTVCATMVLIFISIGVGHLLATTVAKVAAYLYVAGFYVVLLVLLVVFRKRLFIDPAARFISKLLVNPPTESHRNETDKQHPQLK